MGLKIKKMSEQAYNSLQTKEKHTMYLLDNGMFFIDGKMYGASEKFVEEFPSSPIPNVVYVTESKKGILINGIWREIEIGRAGGAQDSYVHPSTHPASMIVQDSNHRFVSDNEKNIWNSKINSARAQELINNALDNLPEVNEGRSWELVGATTGSKTVAIDSTKYSEFLVICGNDLNASEIIIPSIHLSDNIKVMSFGYYANETNARQYIIKATNTSIQYYDLDGAGFGNFVDSNMIVYGKR